MELSEIKVGQRVELHPATDRWMMGDRYGEVKRINPPKGEGEYVVRVKLDKSEKTLGFFPHNILKEV